MGRDNSRDGAAVHELSHPFIKGTAMKYNKCNGSDVLRVTLLRKVTDGRFD